MKKVKIILIFLVAVLVVSCDSNTIQEIQPIVTNPRYNANIKPIFSAKCVSCHGSNAQNPPLNNYAEVKDAIENGSVLCRIQGECGEVMPPSGKMPQGLIDLINNWKDQGYVE